MIVKKYWDTHRGHHDYRYWKGWFLFGFIPLYIEELI